MSASGQLITWLNKAANILTPLDVPLLSDPCRVVIVDVVAVDVIGGGLK